MSRDSTVTSQPAPVLMRYLRHQRAYSAVLLVTLLSLTMAARIVTQIVDVARWDVPIQTWEIVVWESSSVLVILALIPAMVVFDRYAPFTWGTWRRSTPKHLLGSVFFSIVHVSAMLLLRKLAYAIAGSHYEFEDWLGQWLYEYLKDIRTYFALLFVIYAYRLILLRLQGEALELDRSETAPPTDASPTQYTDKFLVRKLDKDFLIAAQEIEWLEAQGNYVNLHVSGRAYPLRSTMAAIEARLDPAKFIRVHRSRIINMGHLVEIEPLESGDARLKLRDGTSVQCSRTYRANLKEQASTLGVPKPRV